MPFGISDEKVRLALLAQNDTKTAFGSNANLIPRRFARRASFEATVPQPTQKGHPKVSFELSMGYEKDIFGVL